MVLDQHLLIVKQKRRRVWWKMESGINKTTAAVFGKYLGGYVVFDSPVTRYFGISVTAETDKITKRYWKNILK